MAWVACRHHVMELVLPSIFQALGQQEGQNVAVFKRFQTSWPYIDQSAHETASDDDMFDSCTAVLRAEMVNFCKVALEESQPRRLQGIPQYLHDFAGWRRSCRSFLSSTWSISSGTMDAKAIYSVKLFLLQHQFT